MLSQDQQLNICFFLVFPLGVELLDLDEGEVVPGSGPDYLPVTTVVIEAGIKLKQTNNII